MQDKFFPLLPDGACIGALPGSLQALVVATAFMHAPHPCLWIVADTEEMYARMEALSCFLDERHIRMFFAPDVRPFQDDSPSSEIIAKRISILYDLLTGQNMIVIAPADAAVGATIPPKELSRCIMEFFVGQELDRQDLASRLVYEGYTAEALIDDVGQFSIRGSVMDIFSPGMDLPVRIDMFGDTIEEIKTFDAATQRSKGYADSALVLPVTEVLWDRGHTRQARPFLRRMKDEWVGSMINDLERGIPVPGIESYLPLFYEKTASVYDFFGPGAGIICPDTPDMKAMWKNTLRMYAKAHEKASMHRSGLLQPESMIMDPDKFSLSGSGPGFMHEYSTSLGTKNSQAISFAPFSIETSHGNEVLIDRLEEMFRSDVRVFIFCPAEIQAQRLCWALEQRGIPSETIQAADCLDPHNIKKVVRVVESALSSGFVLYDPGMAFIPFGTKAKGVKKKAAPGVPVINPFTQLNMNDPVVHRDNGIGVFKGVERMDIQGVKSDFVMIEYLGGDRLYVPVYRLSLLQRYIGSPDAFIVDRLGGKRWSKAKAKARQSVAAMAKELVDIYAKREASKGFSFDISNRYLSDFEDGFPYDETPDQQKAIEDMYADMASSRPMDRLVCGDVGYGKTEVALRSAFAAAIAGRQVAVLVPTTLLARQHTDTFRQRLMNWPLRVEGLTSFSTSVANAAVREDLAAGRVDIIIGTHGLLSKKVKFHDLGLLIVDEEHRFGVSHKERIKAMRAEVDILTLTATPIPRTLNMAMSGIRDLSVIETPPAKRKAIETLVSRFDDDEIAQAINREIFRGGQVFFVHNRVASIASMTAHIKAICPQARVETAHGQMPKAQLNRVMERFVSRSCNVLVTSAIISSGIDIPTANTIIIHRADYFGLADLYQLRGRVGRSTTRGYCLLLLPETGQITKDAHKRLSALKTYESLGAGFQMAMMDMEIRGAGDILGKAQWGQVTAIGYELYQQMLEDAVSRQNGQEPKEQIDPEISIGMDAFLPEDYCPDQHLRLGLYKRLSMAAKDEIDTIYQEINDVYGPMPSPVKTLFGITELRIMLRDMGVKKLERITDRLRLYPARDTQIDLSGLVAMVEQRKGRMYPDGRIDIPLKSPEVIFEIRDILSHLF
ncbi:MAG: transcription-repair coupling factor [Thermodesulfobacteriota bacterium]|nr:transcription-repair coupling factor [Thermodesulfobacteriota bacterium]